MIFTFTYCFFFLLPAALLFRLVAATLEKARWNSDSARAADLALGKSSSVSCMSAEDWVPDVENLSAPLHLNALRAQLFSRCLTETLPAQGAMAFARR